MTQSNLGRGQYAKRMNHFYPVLGRGFAPISAGARFRCKNMRKWLILHLVVIIKIVSLGIRTPTLAKPLFSQSLARPLTPRSARRSTHVVSIANNDGGANQNQ